MENQSLFDQLPEHLKAKIKSPTWHYIIWSVIALIAVVARSTHYELTTLDALKQFYFNDLARYLFMISLGCLTTIIISCRVLDRFLLLCSLGFSLSLVLYGVS